MHLHKQKILLSLFKSGKYFCDADGNVFGTSYKKPQKLSPCPDSDGYPKTSLHYRGKQYNFSVHACVYLYFNGRHDHKKQINHIDGNKTNNSLSNLELVTASENERHAHKIGLKSQKGSKNGATKLTEKDIKNIRNKYVKRTNSALALAEKYGICYSNIMRIIRRDTWTHI